MKYEPAFLLLMIGIALILCIGVDHLRNILKELQKERKR